MGLIDRILRKDPPPATCKLGALEIGHPWVRISSARSGEAGGFLTVRNAAGSADRLVTASSALAAQVEIHAIKVVGGDITMRPLEHGLSLPPETTLTLRPRGYHLMLRGVESMPAKGSRLPIVLSFEQAGTIELEFTVEDEGPIGNDILLEENQPR